MKNLMMSFVGLFGLMLFAQVASADVLYWKVVGTAEVYKDSTWKNKETIFEHFKNVDNVNVRVAYGTVDENGVFLRQNWLDVLKFDEISGDYASDGNSTPLMDYSEFGIDEAAGPVFSQLADGAEDFYYQIQFYEGNSLRVISDAESYEDISAFTNAGEYVGGFTDPWTGKYFMAPEPSSGLLVLFGALLFGLKRKQEII